MIEKILAILLALPVHFTDREEPTEARRQRMQDIAEAVDEASLRATCQGPHAFDGCRRAWTGPRKHLVAALITIGKHESYFASYVRTDCLAGPKGSQCDLDHRTGQPRARGYWQLWAVAWPPLWRLEPGSPEALREAAYGAAVRWSGAWLRCRDRATTPAAGAFAGYAGSDCLRPSSMRRAATWARLMARL